MKIIILFYILLSLVGCGFVTIEIHQSAILDKGDATKDEYTNKSPEVKEDTGTVKVPAIF